MHESTDDKSKRDASFLAFYLVWARLQGWKLPDLHIELCAWLEQTQEHPLALLMIFRGAAKSTIVGVFKAWQLWQNPATLHQVWGADKKVATKMSRYVRFVLRRHPWCGGMLDPRAGDNGYFVSGNKDARNPSMEAIGVDSSATGSRSTDTCFDDIEVPKNIRTPAKREGLREKIDEAIHILVPGGRRLYVGTPHTHKTIYQDVEDEGADMFKRALFSQEQRIAAGTNETRFKVTIETKTDGLTVLSGVHKFARLLREGRDYMLAGGYISFAEPLTQDVDVYSGNAWPERFTQRDVLIRRRACRTINSWDSQYQLRATPVQDTRLDPDRMPVYDEEIRIEWRNRTPVMMLGDVQIAGFVTYWDVSLGKVKSDASALSVVLTDYAGRLYWHRCVELVGDLEIVNARNQLTGGQVHQVRELMRQLHLHQVHVEVNGPGGFVPPILTRHCKPWGISVTERFQTANKQARILDAFEAPLSSGFLWCHTSVTDSPGFEQLRTFNPALKDQPDDYIDATAGAILETPIRLERILTPDESVRPVDRTQGRRTADALVSLDWS